jgi:hypothetical protein
MTAPDMTGIDLGDDAPNPGQQPGTGGSTAAGGDAGTPATPPDMAGIDLGDDAPTPTDYNKDFMTVAGNSVASGWKHSGVGDIANAAYQQTKHVVTTPIEYYQQAVDAFKAGDTKAGLEAAQQGLISLTTFGSGDNNSPMGKVFASLLMHPLQQLQKQLDMDRKNGALPSAGAESVVNRIKDIPNVWNSHLQASENEVNNGVQNAVDDWKAGNGTGALSDILIKPFDSPIAGSVPGAGPFLQEEGHDINRDMHDHNFGSLAGDLLGPLATWGMGRAFGTLAKGADAMAVDAESAAPDVANVEGTDIPVSKNNPTMGTAGNGATPLATKWSTKEGAKAFQKTQEAAGAQASKKTITSGAMDLVDRLRTARGEQPTAPFAPHLEDFDDTVKFMKDEAQKTYQQLDNAALNDVAEWEQKYGPNSGYKPTATQPTVSPRPGPNPTGDNAQAIADWDAKNGEKFKPDGTVKKPVPDAPAPPKPKLFSEIQHQLQVAKKTEANTVLDPKIRDAARTEIPALQNEMKAFVAKYGSKASVSPEELDAANELYKQHMRMEWVADAMRTGVKGTQKGSFTAAISPNATAEFLRKLPARFNNAFGSVANKDAWSRLLGKDGVNNYNNILNVMAEPTSGKGFWSFLSSIPKIGKMPLGALADSVLYNPDTGSAAIKLFKMYDALTKIDAAGHTGASLALKGAPVAGPAAATPQPNFHQDFGKRVMVDGKYPATILGTHPNSGKKFLEYDK